MFYEAKIGNDGGEKSMDAEEVNITLQSNTDYSLKNVTSLMIIGAAVKCHGFISFGSSTPTISISNIDHSSGDDITGAAANEIWEFDCYPFDGKSYIIWSKKE